MGAGNAFVGVETGGGTCKDCGQVAGSSGAGWGGQVKVFGLWSIISRGFLIFKGVGFDTVKKCHIVSLIIQFNCSNLIS